ncbi:MAG: hypothetical protein QXS20_02490 [Candidatus Thorarchaeota archaeon]
MSTSWFFKSRQMSEAGKELLLREALVSHARSSRDRQTLETILKDRRPLEDILSFFSSFYLYNYQGLRLLKPAASNTTSDEQSQALVDEERRLLELEIRQLLGDRQRQELEVARLVSESIILLCEAAEEGQDHLLNDTRRVLSDLFKSIPSDYCPTMTIDLLNELTGWGQKTRDELYVRASGPKESSLSLREEMMREHEHECIEISLLKRMVQRIRPGATHIGELLNLTDLDSELVNEIVQAIVSRIPRNVSSRRALMAAEKVRSTLIETLQSEIEVPRTVYEMEQHFSSIAARRLLEVLKQREVDAIEVLGAYLRLDPADVRAALRSGGIPDSPTLLKALEGVGSAQSQEESGYSDAQFEVIDRSIKTLERLEGVLEKQVKGFLRSRGFRSSDIESVRVDFLAKPRGSLMAIEQQVLDELQKRVRVPPPEEVAQLLEVRRSASQRQGIHAGPSLAELSEQRRLAEVGVNIGKDLLWHLMVSVVTNLTRILELYLRSKQDLLRFRALLKSIWEDQASEFQFVREEVLVDVLSRRMVEMKCVLPELETETISIWMHSRLSSSDLTTAENDLRSTPSPVFEGVATRPLDMASLRFDNYAVAFDIMQRFLNRQRQALLEREQYAYEQRLKERELTESKKKSIDALQFIYTKAHTVLKAIGRVGTKGLEWSGTDSAKCSNLLSFYVASNRGRPVCQVCGSTPADGVCPTHGKGNMSLSDDFDSLSIFVMNAISDIKSGLIGPTAVPMSYSEARQIVQRELNNLRRRGRLTSKTNIKELLPGEVNHIVGPAIAEFIGSYFNDSLKYAARRTDLA